MAAELIRIADLLEQRVLFQAAETLTKKLDKCETRVRWIILSSLFILKWFLLNPLVSFTTHISHYSLNICSYGPDIYLMECRAYFTMWPEPKSLRRNLSRWPWLLCSWRLCVSVCPAFCPAFIAL